MNVELLQKVKAHILAQPNRLVMGDWISKKTPGEEVADGSADEAFVIVPECGTVGCIAGWTVLLAEGPDAKMSKVSERAAGHLGINGREHQLFHVDEWDLEDQERWEQADGAWERAQIAAGVIDNFIQQQK